jgi:uncharacterized protein YciU (UPF0263 family)
MFKKKKTVKVSADITTIKEYQDLMNAEAKRKREMFKICQELGMSLGVMIRPQEEFVEFVISFLNEKGEKIETVFAKAKLPTGLNNTQCWADKLGKAKFENEVLPSGSVKSYAYVPLV